MSNAHRTEWIPVTPQLAEKWLDTKAPNRHISDATVMEYALVMEAGGWEETHQGIAFDDKGRLCDGQHRLKAITLLKPGAIVRLLVTRGLTKDEVLALDRGRVRDSADSLTIYRGERVEKYTVAVANRVIHISPHYAAKAGATPGATWRVSTTELDVFLRAHEAAMLRALSLRHRVSKVGLTSALMGSLIFRAHYHLPSTRLDQFIDVIATGHYDDPDADSAALLLREHVMAKMQGYRGTNLMDHYRMERAIKAFWKKEKLARIYPSTEELFPLPEEKGDAKLPAVIQRMERLRAQRGSTAGLTRKLARATAGDSL